MDDLSLDPYAGLLINVEVIGLEKHLGLLLRHIWGHLRDEIDGNYFTFFVILFLKFQGQAQDLLPFFASEFMGDLGQQNAAFLSDLN